MNNENNILALDFRSRYAWAVRVRYGVLAGGFLALLFAYVFNPTVDLRNNLALVVFVAVYNLVAQLIFRLKIGLKLWQIVGLITCFQVLDLTAITLLIYFTGWLESPYWFMYLVLIIIAGFGVFSRYSLTVFFIASFSAIFYFGLLVAAYLGIIPVYGATFSLPPQELLQSILNRMVFTLVSFFLFAATIYYFSELLNESQAKLAQKNRELLSVIDELKEIDRIKDEVVTNVSHELRTPLSVIREDICLIKDGALGDVSERQIKLLSGGIENVDRLEKILNGLLDIYKVQSRSFNLQRQRSDVGEAAKKAVGLMKEFSARKRIEIGTELAEGISGWIDPDQISRVFINLIDNAVKYSSEGGEVIVRVENLGDKIKASVKDNGIGIAEKDTHLLFERFMRLHRTEDMANRGSGLGLAICKAIIEMHGGKIWVESKAGQGAKFIFTLPRLVNNG